ncbi:MAG TPA: DHA2 family efflux MFS transporter permease subunit [Polyangia bacterium]|nr:DHA2 family efflux MFS transporter permease subunit [Polyangia bacterium]
MVRGDDEAASDVSRIVPWLVAVAFFMESLDTTILNTAVPTLAEALGVAPLSIKSVLSSYTLSLAVFIPVSGWVADRFGTRRVFASAIGLFTLGSVLCGLSTDIHELILFRVLQGVGGAMMVPVGRLTMVRTFARSELVRAMAFVAIPGLVGPMLGPVAGGAIVRFTTWRLIFFINVPIGLGGLFLVWRHLPDYRDAHVAPLDVVGLVLFGSGVALLSYVLEVFGEHSLGAFEILGLLGASVALLFGYTQHAATTSYPLLRLALLRVRTLRIAVAGSFVTRIGVGGMPFLLPLLYQVGLGYSPLQSGLLILPQSVAAMGLRLLMPRLLRRLGYRRVLLINTAMIGLIIGLFALVGPGTPASVIVVQAFAFGFFSSFQYTSMNTLGFADISDADASRASTISSAAQQMSMSFGVAAASLTAALFIPGHAAGDAAAFVHGIHRAFVALGVFTILSALVFRGLTSTDGDAVSQHKIALRSDG